MILLRTHSNRWIARARRTGVVHGAITLADEFERPVYKTVRIDAATGERILLRDTDALEEAFAVLIAGVERARLAAVAEAAQEPVDDDDDDDGDFPTDPFEDTVAA